MKFLSRTFPLLFPFLLLAQGCAAPKPILYPNAHLKQVGESAAAQDIEDCFAMAKEAGATPSQGKGGQVAGSTAAGGATGGLLRGLFRKSPPSQAFKQFVNRCLQERGYEPVGWE